MLDGTLPLSSFPPHPRCKPSKNVCQHSCVPATPLTRRTSRIFCALHQRLQVVVQITNGAEKAGFPRSKLTGGTDSPAQPAIAPLLIRCPFRSHHIPLHSFFTLVQECTISSPFLSLVPLLFVSSHPVCIDLPHRAFPSCVVNTGAIVLIFLLVLVICGMQLVASLVGFVYVASVTASPRGVHWGAPSPSPAAAPFSPSHPFSHFLRFLELIVTGTQSLAPSRPWEATTSRRPTHGW